MGSGSFDTGKYYETAASYAKKERTSLFQQSNLFSDFNPLQITTRESCASKEHPDPTSVIIACDVTGSMGKIPENLLKGGLGKVMESLLSIQAISNPQVMFAAVGDTECDRAPLQVTQFESDNRIEAQLKNLYLEGGGGGIGTESYHVIWYFAAYKTRLDSWQKGKKGILFTIGDEMVPSVLPADHIRKFIDKDYTGPDISTSKLLEDVSKKYEVFHLIVQDTNAYSQQLGANKVNACWRKYLEERAILVPRYTEIPEKITSTVKSLCELNLRIEEPVHANAAPAETTQASAASESTAIISSVGLFSSKSSSATSVSASATAVLSKDNDGTPDMFICPVSLTVMEDPVIARDGHNYDRKNIMAWFQSRTTSPLTNETIGTELIPNHDLKSAIRQWQENLKTRAAAPGR